MDELKSGYLLISLCSNSSVAYGLLKVGVPWFPIKENPFLACSIYPSEPNNNEMAIDKSEVVSN